MELEATEQRARPSSGSLPGDRLSALPDCLIHHIMSFMKARQVVQTCVLSPRWKNLWRSAPCLDVDEEEFKAADAELSRNEEWEKFVDFTDHLLTNNIAIALLDTFRLHVGKMYPRGEQASKWIRRGIKYSAQVPGIQRKGLCSSSWRLRKLHLSNVPLDDCFAKHISSGCQNLEDLELKGCMCTFREITSNSLKNLVLEKCTWTQLSEIYSPKLKNLVINACLSPPNCLLVITVPAVAYLLLNVKVYQFGGGVSLNNMPSLSKATIHLQGNTAQSKFSSGLINLLGSLSNVTSLELLGFQTMVLIEESTLFPNFKNLKTLLLDNCDLSDNFKLLRHFMKNSPYLEKLILRCCKFSKDTKKRKRTLRSKKGSSSQCQDLVDVQCKNLKLTEIIYKDDDVLQLVELLLSISENLPKNNIKLSKVN